MRREDQDLGSVSESEEGTTSGTESASEENYSKLHGRPVIRGLIQRHIHDSARTVAVVFCGPRLMNEIRQSVVEGMGETRVDYFEE